MFAILNRLLFAANKLQACNANVIIIIPALDLVTPRHAEELVSVLRKEATRAAGASHDDAAKYRQLLVRAMHRAAIQVNMHSNAHNIGCTFDEK